MLHVADGHTNVSKINDTISGKYLVLFMVSYEIDMIW